MNNTTVSSNPSANIILIITSIIVIYAMYQIEQNAHICECAINSKKQFIKEWFIFIVIINVIALFAGPFIIYHIFSSSDTRNILLRYLYFIIPFVFVMMVVHIIMVFRTFIYINYLRTSCKCAYNLPQKILFWMFTIYICLFIITITLLAILIILGYNR